MMLDQTLRREFCIIHEITANNDNNFLNLNLGSYFGTTLLLLLFDECRQINGSFTKFI